MKILAIRGCNLASIEGEFEIDFTREPLKSAGIFAITGHTGSGKSTLLDAVCLALFNKTPRGNQTGRENVLDVNEKEIQTGDPRHILRRGTGNGYAEVEFIALDGKAYRSRWSVRRARDKASGALQPWEITLFNLSEGSELQGDKTELLRKITDLIGLTYDQFTRAVLLAQGDFATFLKAEKKEKAELLEKLTGTAIYSDISKLIFTKTKEAVEATQLIERDIQNIALLSEEEIEEKIATLSQTKSELESNQRKIELESKQYAWLQADLQLQHKINEAKQQLQQNQNAMVEAKPRFDYLTKLETVQEIRDDYKSLQTLSAQKEENEKKRNAQQQEKQKIIAQINTATTNQQNWNDKKIYLEERWKKAQANIQQAKTLDALIENSTSTFKHAQNDYLSHKKQQNDLKDAQEKCIALISTLQSAKQELNNWLQQHTVYEPIAPKIALIQQYIQDANQYKAQIIESQKNEKNLTQKIHNEEKNLQEAEKKSTELNQTLSTEIIILRKKLVEGKPCPVCGSIEHSYEKIEGHSLNDEILTKEKEKATQKIAQLQNLLKKLHEELASAHALSENYTQQYEVNYHNIKNLLTKIPDWETLFNEGQLSQQLHRIIENWVQKTEEAKQKNEEISLATQSLTQHNQQIEVLNQSVAQKEKHFQEENKKLQELSEKRTGIFKGERVTHVEKIYQDQVDKTEKELAQATESLQDFIGKQKEIEGIISQLSTFQTNTTAQLEQVQQTINLWLQRKEARVHFEELASLFSKEPQWVQQERENLEKLKNDILTANNTLSERMQNWTEHQKSETKAEEGATAEKLTQQLESLKNTITELTDKQNLLTATLHQNKEAEHKATALKKTFAKKKAHADQWEKLNSLLGSSEGAKFRNIAQGYTLDVLLAYANSHLKEISSRYILTRSSPESLALQVIDLDMMSEKRTVHSLSGGESFLVSLALALGLSSLSSNRMQIESLFIDEGFGTLDSETLRTAMEVLGSLQNQGRKIGVISHVTEMMDEISTKIKVEKMGNGKSKVLVM